MQEVVRIADTLTVDFCGRVERGYNDPSKLTHSLFRDGG